jgi:hypothetical protein
MLAAIKVPEQKLRKAVKPTPLHNMVSSAPQSRACRIAPVYYPTERNHDRPTSQVSRDEQKSYHSSHSPKYAMALL